MSKAEKINIFLSSRQNHDELDKVHEIFHYAGMETVVLAGMRKLMNTFYTPLTMSEKVKLLKHLSSTTRRGILN